MSFPKVKMDYFDLETINDFFHSLNGVSNWSRTDHIGLMLEDYKNDLEDFIESNEGFEPLMESYNFFHKEFMKTLEID